MVSTILTASWGLDHLIFCLLGIVVSAYALYVEERKHKDPKYVAFCDFNEHMSCSKVLTSEYSQGFGLTQLLVGKEHFLNLPNCILGIFFFSLQLILGFYTANPWCTTFLFYSSVVSVIGSLYLAYVLFVILKDICIVCIATYVINFALLYLNYALV